MIQQSAVYVVSTEDDGPIMAYLDKVAAVQFSATVGGLVRKVGLRVRMSDET